MLTDARRRAYLDALGIVHYQRRGDVASTTDTDADIAPPAIAGAAPAAAPTAAPTSERPRRGQQEAPASDWNTLKQQVAACRACTLGETRQNAVFGVGDPAADVLFVGEAPGAEEDRRGEPFVGRAGQLLDEMLRAVGLSRSNVFIANMLKCRPPNNRDPATDELAACRDYLKAQVAHVQPRLLVAVGRIAAQALLGVNEPLGRLRGQLHHSDDWPAPVLVTYHPAYLLRTPAQKARSWQDLKMLRQTLANS